MQEISVVCAGLSCIDIIKSEANVEYNIGGTAANVASILSQLGLKVAMLVPRYNDSFADLLFEQLQLRKIRAIEFGKSILPTPRIIEHCNNGGHSFETKCSICGRTLTKTILPSGASIQRLNDRIWQNLNLFYFDRISDGIKAGVQRARKSHAWVYYEPNCCRQFSTFYNNVAQADIVKFSEEAIPQSYIDRLVSDLNKPSKTKLLIVSKGDRGLKYALRTPNGVFENWMHLEASSVGNIVDTSGAGDWLTASFLWFFLNKYPNVQDDLSTDIIKQILVDSQIVASHSCLYLGAQGVFSSAGGISFLRDQFNREIRILSKVTLSFNDEFLCKNCLSRLER